jgi:hypothetical protein
MDHPKETDMKKTLLALTAFLTVIMAGFNAYALSEQNAPVNRDGSAKFSDPDETPQPYVNLQSTSAAGGHSLDDPSSAPVTLQTPSTRMSSESEAAFDHAYHHLQGNK